MTDNIAQSVLGNNTQRFRTIEQVNSFHTLGTKHIYLQRIVTHHGLISTHVAAQWSHTQAFDPIMQPLAILGLGNKRGEISLWR